jgi:hypothetical protein
VRGARAGGARSGPPRKPLGGPPGAPHAPGVTPERVLASRDRRRLPPRVTAVSTPFVGGRAIVFAAGRGRDSSPCSRPSAARWAAVPLAIRGPRHARVGDARPSVRRFLLLLRNRPQHRHWCRLDLRRRAPDERLSAALRDVARAPVLDLGWTRVRAHLFGARPGRDVQRVDGLDPVPHRAPLCFDARRDLRSRVVALRSRHRPPIGQWTRDELGDAAHRGNARLLLVGVPGARGRPTARDRDPRGVAGTGDPGARRCGAVRCGPGVRHAAALAVCGAAPPGARGPRGRGRPPALVRGQSAHRRRAVPGERSGDALLERRLRAARASNRRRGCMG